ncbi:MAG: DUF2520 domain-containing protein [Acidobacteria bacterium]|nr:DUF2520 domain-containing protein [Acidobacteriota bacterium]MCW5950490.1 DUF2520 domain-containing protein [Pyrinomonadaceae bacterium]
MKTFSVIGAGRVGTALWRTLSSTGRFEADLLVDRSAKEKLSGAVEPDSVSEVASDIVLITTQDDAIEDASKWLSAVISGPAVVLHTSGSRSSEVLGDLRARECSVGSMHPLLSIAGGDTQEIARGAYYCIEGDASAVAAATELVKALGGRSVTVATPAKPLYHAAAVLACGHVVALFELALRSMSAAGIERETAYSMLEPLVRGTVDGIFERGTEAALTGPFARADRSTIRLNLDAINEHISPEIAEIYRLLGGVSLELAAENGVDVRPAIKELSKPNSQ